VYKDIMLGMNWAFAMAILAAIWLGLLVGYAFGGQWAGDFELILVLLALAGLSAFSVFLAMSLPKNYNGSTLRQFLSPKELSEMRYGAKAKILITVVAFIISAIILS